MKMFDTDRRSRISTSELGLYSDRSERLYDSGYGTVVIKQFVIASMIVIMIVLIALFFYDVSSSAIIQRQAQDTNNVYIIQDAFEKFNKTPKILHISPSPIVNVNRTTIPEMQDRSDDLSMLEDDNSDNESREIGREIPEYEPESRAQNLHNFKMRKRFQDHRDRDVEESHTRNHATIYRVKNRKHTKEDRKEPQYGSAKLPPSPFRYELKTPQPMSFKKQKYPQLSQYRYPQTSRNIQDIIKYLSSNDVEDDPRKGIKFSGVYMNPKKLDAHFDMGEMVSAGTVNAEQNVPSPNSKSDPLFRYKPKHPADVNLLAPNNLRFTPSGIQRYAQYYPRPTLSSHLNNPSFMSEYDSAGVYSSSGEKKAKPKPFSVMLDIYPITDVNEQSAAASASRPWPPPFPTSADFEPKRPHFSYNGPRRTRKHYPVPLIPAGAASEFSPNYLQEEPDKQHMILHLNLYPRKKSRSSRRGWQSNDEKNLLEEMMSPFGRLTKQLTDHFTIENSKLGEGRSLDDNNISLFQAKDIAMSQKETPYDSKKFHTEYELSDTPDKRILDHEKLVATTDLLPEETTTVQNEPDSTEIDIDTVQGFQKFADSLFVTE